MLPSKLKEWYGSTEIIQDQFELHDILACYKNVIVKGRTLNHHIESDIDELELAILIAKAIEMHEARAPSKHPMSTEEKRRAARRFSKRG
jgi:hypothetical protein